VVVLAAQDSLGTSGRGWGKTQMRRMQLLATTILPLLMFSVASAQAPKDDVTAQAQSKYALLEKVDVLRGTDGLRLEIRASGKLSPTATMVTDPDRLVIDLPDVVVTHFRNIAVGNGGVKAVRVGQNNANPPMARVVVDLVQARGYELIPAGEKVVVMLHPVAGTKTVTSAEAKLRPIVEKSQETPNITDVQKSVTAVKAPPAPSENADSAAKDFVFVEPAYKAQPVSASVRPPQRVLEAAATMAATRPESLSLPRESAALSASQETQPAPVPASQPAPSVQESQTPSTSASPAPVQMKPAVNMAAEQLQQLSQGVPAPGKARYTGEPISVNLKDVDLRDFFRLVHEISGLNIVLDPYVHGTLTIVLDDVPWDQALDIVLKNNGLDRQLEGNVLRIATLETLRKEAEARRAQIEAQAMAVDKITVTRFLSYAHSKDVVPTLKKLLSSRGDIISDDRTNALIIQDIAAVIPEVDRLIAQLDRKTQEVEIEARVVAATRTFARDIGTQLGFSWGSGSSAVTGASSVGTSPNVSAPPPGAQFFTIAGSNGVPLFSNMPAQSPTAGISFANQSSNYRLDFVLTMAESRGLLKILSRPRVVTQNNIQALVRQGFRIPVVTQAQLGGPPTTTYVDAFLRLTVTPQITAESTIFLNVDVENTTPDFSRTVLGNPTLITQQATTQVLVTDGGTVVIGGVIQTTNSLNIQQVPLLGNIPVMGNLFKRRTVSTSTQELIFFITPKIIQT